MNFLKYYFKPWENLLFATATIGFAIVGIRLFVMGESWLSLLAVLPFIGNLIGDFYSYKKKK